MHEVVALELREPLYPRENGLLYLLLDWLWLLWNLLTRELILGGSHARLKLHLTLSAHTKHSLHLVHVDLA